MGGRESRLRHFIRTHFPFFFIKCPGFNYHPFWHTLCYCQIGINGRETPEALNPSNTITIWKDGSIRFWNGMDAFYAQADKDYLLSFSLSPILSIFRLVSRR